MHRCSVLVIGCMVCLLAAAAPLAAAEPAKPAPAAMISGDLRVISSTPIPVDRVMQYDLLGEYQRLRKDSCTTLGTTVTLSFPENAPMIDSVITITGDHGAPIMIEAKPWTNISGKIGGVGYTIACDSDVPRFYYANPVLGYVTAYDLSGNELWRKQLAPFLPLEGGREYDLSQIMELLLENRSNIKTIVSNGPFILVEERTGGRGFSSHIFDRDGRRVGVVGPGDTVFYKSVPRGFEFLAGGGTDLRFYIPQQALTIEPSDRRASILEHALAWLTPRPVARSLDLSLCPAVPVDEIRYRLGERYREEDATLTRRLILSHGKAWLAEFLKHDPLPGIAQRLNPASQAWVKEYHDGLLSAGFDAVLDRWMDDDHVETTRVLR